jgi:Rab GDP dissociation inhibitor
MKGGALMMDQAMPEIVFDKTSGKAIGIKSGDQAAVAPFVMGQPRFFPKDKTKVQARVARAICLMDHPIPNTVREYKSVLILTRTHTLTQRYRTTGHTEWYGHHTCQSSVQGCSCDHVQCREDQVQGS